MQDDRVIKSYLSKHESHAEISSIRLPKYVYYDNKSDKFCILDDDFETYSQFIDKCKGLMPKPKN